MFIYFFTELQKYGNRLKDNIFTIFCLQKQLFYDLTNKF